MDGAGESYVAQHASRLLLPHAALVKTHHTEAGRSLPSVAWWLNFFPPALKAQVFINKQIKVGSSILSI